RARCAASRQREPSSRARHLVHDAVVRVPTRTTELGTPHYDAVGTVHRVLSTGLAQASETGTGWGHSSPDESRGAFWPDCCNRLAEAATEDTADVVGGREQLGGRLYGPTGATGEWERAQERAPAPVAEDGRSESAQRRAGLSSLFDEEMPDLLAAAC